MTRAEVRQDGITYLESLGDWYSVDRPAHSEGCGHPCGGGAAVARQQLDRLMADLDRHKERGDELARQLIEARNGPRKPSTLPEDLAILRDLDALRGRIHGLLGPDAWRQVRDAFEPVRKAVLLSDGSPR